MKNIKKILDKSLKIWYNISKERQRKKFLTDTRKDCTVKL